MRAKSIDLSRWSEVPRGVAYRRWVITATGIRLLLRTKLFRLLLVFAWLAGGALAAAGFLFSQSIAPGGLLEQLAGYLGPRALAVVSGLGAYVTLYPDIVVEGLFTLLFRFQASIGQLISLIALSGIIPTLITQDRASSALTIYLSRPLSSLDYLIGKFGIIVGVLVMVWTGPLIFGWLLSIAFAPDATFLVYSIEPMMRALLYNLIVLAVLSPIAIGISSVARTNRSTVLLWIGAWIILGAIASAPVTPAIVQHASFSHNLEQVNRAIFDLNQYLESSSEALPFLAPDVSRNLEHMANALSHTDLKAAIIGLVALVGVSCLVFLRRLKPE